MQNDFTHELYKRVHERAKDAKNETMKTSGDIFQFFTLCNVDGWGSHSPPPAAMLPEWLAGDTMVCVSLDEALPPSLSSDELESDSSD